ncbi:MAG: carboxypeptidase-like regulatory domain-containing protein, partial [Deltaproteobacteria bacterium]|nr:carboxypeptidase-like regulatory domain-containing protein [Deltaproteobacteria bacterium]
MKLLGNFIIATLLIVMGCSTEIEPVNPFDPETSPNNKAKGGISGRINPEDIKDLKKITFTVTITDSQFNAIVSEDGTFRFNELPQGNYFLKVIASDKSYKEEQIGPFEVKPGQTVYAGTIPLILKKGLIRGSFVTTSGNNLKNPAAFIPVFIGKSEEKKKINLLLTDSKDRCASDTATEGYITSTDGSGRIRIDNIRVGKYRAILSDDSAGIGISQEFEIREDKETDIGEITVMPPGALLHIEDTDAAGVAIDVTAKNKVRVVFGLQNFSGEAMVYADGSPETAEWKDISNTNYSEITIPGEGIVPIYVKFRDIFCRESPVFRTSVYRDISLPVIKGVSIDDIVKEQDSEYSKSSTIKIHIDATDDYHNFKSDFSDMKMKITTENPENTEWEDFNTEKDYYLGEQDGEKLLRILLKDKAGNVSETFVKNIILDKTPPKNVLMQISGKVLDINGNYTEHNSLTLISTVKFRFESDSFGGKVFLYGKSGSQQTTCDIAMENGKTINLIKTETGSYAEIEEEIKGEDGEKSYIACFADTAGNIRSTPETATIYLDRSPPSNVMFRINNGNNYSTSGEIKITNITAYDNYHGNMYIK